MWDVFVSYMREDAREVGALAKQLRERRIEIWGKADLHAGTSELLCVSGQTGEGLSALRTLLASRLGAGEASAVSISSTRHLEALEQTMSALTRARAACHVSTLEVVAGELGIALHSLSEVTSLDPSTALLDTIFQRFCIGK